MFNEKIITIVYKFIMQNNNPLSPHLQIYKWHLSSLLSITHRVVGVINFFALMVICFWAISLFFGENFYRSFEIILNTFFLLVKNFLIQYKITQINNRIIDK